VRHRPRRAAGAQVVLADGRLVLYVERGGRSLLSFVEEPEILATAATALAARVTAGRIGALQLQRVDGDAPMAQPVLDHLRAAGFADHPRGLVLRPARAGR
jgi:ATP-dependent Lhr-like helicase